MTSEGQDPHKAIQTAQRARGIISSFAFDVLTIKQAFDELFAGLVAENATEDAYRDIAVEAWLEVCRTCDDARAVINEHDILNLIGDE